MKVVERAQLCFYLACCVQSLHLHGMEALDGLCHPHLLSYAVPMLLAVATIVLLYLVSGPSLRADN